MRFVKERREIAKALNFGEYPVIMFDLDTPKAGWDGVYEGTTVRVDMGTFSDGSRWLNPTTPTIYVDNYHIGIEDTVEARLVSEIHLPSYGACISSGFSVADVINDAKNAMAPIVKEGDTIAVVYYWNGGKDGAVRLVKLGRVTKHVTPMAVLKD